MTTGLIMLTFIYVISMEFLSLGRRSLSWRKVPSGEDREETASLVREISKNCCTFVFNLFCISGYSRILHSLWSQLTDLNFNWLMHKNAVKTVNSSGSRSKPLGMG